MTLVEIVDFPSKSPTSFKVLQVSLREQPYLVCAGKELGSEHFHGKIFNKFLESQGLVAEQDYGMIAPNPKYPTYKIPVIKQEGLYLLHGAGEMRAGNFGYIQLPRGRSKDYADLGLKGVSKEFNEWLRETIPKALPDWKLL